MSVKLFKVSVILSYEMSIIDKLVANTNDDMRITHDR
jgi:hypothetical protein